MSNSELMSNLENECTEALDTYGEAASEIVREWIDEQVEAIEGTPSEGELLEIARQAADAASAVELSCEYADSFTCIQYTTSLVDDEDEDEAA